MLNIENLPKHQKPKRYLLDCIFNSGGEVEFKALLKTNVDLHKLAQVDFKSFIFFVQEKMANRLSRGWGNPNIFRINDTDTQDPKQETLAKLADDATAQMKEHAQLNLIYGKVVIAFDYEYPTTLEGFSLINKKDYKILKLSTPYQIEAIF